MLAGLYLTLQAEFIAALQVLVYAGAIMVLVIFVIMLLNLGNEEKLSEGSNIRKLAGYTLGSLLTATLFISLVSSKSDMKSLPMSAVDAGSVSIVYEMERSEDGKVKTDEKGKEIFAKDDAGNKIIQSPGLGKTLFDDYLFHFEAITLLLLVAVVGALILARRKESENKLRGEY